jgi:hypothetical protein
MSKRGPKAKFGRTEDAAALFVVLRDGGLGYRRALREVSALLGVPERNIERAADPGQPEGKPGAKPHPQTTRLPLGDSGQLVNLALCAIAANEGLIRANLRERAVDGVANWPDPLKSAVEKLIPGT